MSALSVILDIAVLICLGATIYYAIKLTNSLNAFRQMRQEFNGIMHQLTKNITDAQRGVEALKNASRDSGLELQKTINESRKMAQQLSSLNDTAQGRIADVILNNSDVFDEIRQEIEAEDDLDFFIHDRESEEGAPEAPSSSGFQSKAERDLYESLQKRKPSGRGAA
jgi:hypothetical protein